jgi:hypothetical protein
MLSHDSVWTQGSEWQVQVLDTESTQYTSMQCHFIICYIRNFCLLVLSSQAHLWASGSDNGDLWFGWSVSGTSCCLLLPTQSFLILSFAGLMTLFCCLTTLVQTLTVTPKLLIALTSSVILGSKSHGTHDHILLSDSCGSLQTIPWALVSSPALCEGGPKKKTEFVVQASAARWLFAAPSWISMSAGVVREVCVSVWWIFSKWLFYNSSIF